ncbi:sugar transporter ERD6-like 7 [Olea europaea var. sylvestris]|uniref:sugar transporter ERD6-like 7 n=1 Tax=Olea europaea var. sylvestris TaxID=158386 RepID=UPI000C1D1C65|nr:sugar transporter ERD6-like 7 [Olea europaea var. sylvestris]
MIEILLKCLVEIYSGKKWRSKKFKAALRRLRGKKANISKEAAEIQDYIETLEKLPEAKVLDLFQKRYLSSVTVNLYFCFFFSLSHELDTTTLYSIKEEKEIILLFIYIVQIGVGLMVFQQFGGINGICFYTSSIFESAGKYMKNDFILFIILPSKIQVSDFVK